MPSALRTARFSGPNRVLREPLLGHSSRAGAGPLRRHSVGGHSNHAQNVMFVAAQFADYGDWKLGYGDTIAIHDKYPG
jgi:hypothetical protein